MSAGEWTLAIETSNPSACPGGAGTVALARAGDVFERRLAPSGRHDDALMPAIDALTRAQGAAPRDIGRVAVSLGPGGYTSVRIAVTTAKMLCEATGAGCIGVPTACVAAHAHRTSTGDVDVLVGLASKRERAWMCVVRASASAAFEEAGVCDGDEAVALTSASGVSVCLADEHFPAAMRAALEGAGVAMAPLSLTASACAAVSRLIEPTAPERLVPIYPRAPEAVRVWKRRKG